MEEIANLLWIIVMVMVMVMTEPLSKTRAWTLSHILSRKVL